MVTYKSQVKAIVGDPAVELDSVESGIADFIEVLDVMDRTRTGNIFYEPFYNPTTKQLYKKKKLVNKVKVMLLAKLALLKEILARQYSGDLQARKSSISGELDKVAARVQAI